MTRSRFDQELQRLKDEVMLMGTEVGVNIKRGTAALVNQDVDLAAELVLADDWVNQRQVDIDQDALKLMATQQPVARDMRFVAGLMGVVAELERIHDYVKDSAQITQQIKGHRLPAGLLAEFPRMAENCALILHGAMTAFEHLDEDQARAVPLGDAAVEVIYFETYRRLVEYAAAHPEQIDLINRLEWCTHNLARVGDRAINICEWVIYIRTGELIEIEARHRPPLVS